MDNASAAQLAKCFAHPSRIDLLGRLQGGARLSPSAYAEVSGEALGNASYHFKMLESAGAIEVVKTAQRRGALEHFYELNPNQAQEITALVALLAEM